MRASVKPFVITVTIMETQEYVEALVEKLHALEDAYGAAGEGDVVDLLPEVEIAGDADACLLLRWPHVVADDVLDALGHAGEALRLVLPHGRGLPSAMRATAAGARFAVADPR